MSSKERSTVISIFDDQAQAERAITALREAGIPDQCIGMVSPEERDAASGMSGRLINLGVPDQQAVYYQQELEAGRTLVAVHADERFDLSQSTLRRYGGFDWLSRADDSIPNSDQASQQVEDATSNSRDAGDQHMKLHEERLVGETTRRDAGDVVVRKVLDEVPVRRSIDRHIEAVDIERVRVDQVVRERRQPWNEGDTLIVPLYEERLVVHRQLVMSEQLRIHRVQRVESQEVADTVRRERVIVDDPGNFVDESRAESCSEPAQPNISNDPSEHR